MPSDSVGVNQSLVIYRSDLEKGEECGLVAQERLTEPGVTIE